MHESFDLDPDDHVRVESRDEIEFRKWYFYNYRIKDVIFKLREGDRIRVQTFRKGDPVYLLKVEETDLDHELYVRSMSGDRYYLRHSYIPPNSLEPPSPWLHSADLETSYGEVHRLAVLDLVDDD